MHVVIIHHHFCRITNLPLDQFWMRDKSKLRQGLCAGVRVDVYFPGFPTMKHIPHKVAVSRNLCCLLVEFFEGGDRTHVRLLTNSPLQTNYAKTTLLILFK